MFRNTKDSCWATDAIIEFSNEIKPLYSSTTHTGRIFNRERAMVKIPIPRINPSAGTTNRFETKKSAGN